MKKLKRTLSATLLALLAMGGSYFCTNLENVFSGERTVLKYWSALMNRLSPGKKNVVPEDALFINVSGDKQLVDIKDDMGFTVGNAAITDRGKLVDLLSRIKEDGSYRYVLMDISFDDGYATDADSALFGLIATMDRIVIPRHADGHLAGAALEQKAAYADYRTGLKEDNFTKYPLFDKTGQIPSLPLKMYSDLTGRTVRRHGLLYTDGGSLSRKVVFPKMYVQIDAAVGKDKEQTYVNMGADILSYDNAANFEDKIVVIGSYVDEDIHTSYAGDIPGCVINYNVFLSLMKGHHRIPLVVILLYFLLFFTMSFLLLRGSSEKPQRWGWVWAKLFVLYSAVMTAVCILVFTILGQAHDILLTSTLFSIINVCYKKFAKKDNHA